MHTFILLALLLLAPLPALAGTAEAKDIAKSYNCKVTNIAAVATQTGEISTTTYKADCELPAGVTDQDKKMNGTLLIRCFGEMCTLLKKGE